MLACKLLPCKRLKTDAGMFQENTYNYFLFHLLMRFYSMLPYWIHHHQMLMDICLESRLHPPGSLLGDHPVSRRIWTVNSSHHHSALIFKAASLIPMLYVLANTSQDAPCAPLCGNHACYTDFGAHGAPYLSYFLLHKNQKGLFQLIICKAAGR